MAKNEPVAVLVARFEDEDVARDALRDLNKAKKDGDIEIEDAALLTRDDNDKLHISDSADKGAGRGALIGGVAGAAVGVLAGPIGWAALGGAAVGGLAAKLHDGGFPDDSLRRVGAAVTPGSAALVVVLPDETTAQDVEASVGRWAAEVTRATISPEFAEELDQDAVKAQASST